MGKTKSFPCDTCGKNLTSSQGLHQHEMIHSGIKPYKCDRCNKKFRRKHHLETHQVAHTNERPFKCEFCSESFSWESSLRGHTLIHTGERRWACGQCGKTFIHKSALNAHIRNHIGQKLATFDCEECGKILSVNSRRSHMLTHGERQLYPCYICEKTLKTKLSLKNHVAIHTQQ